MALKEYRRKRHFNATPEPAGAKKVRPKPNQPRFVIQKHAASRLHYDFRLEMDGVLKSWAVPKGPCLDPAQKRLAVQVEDHPLDYAEFEGTIPAGQYGAGQVIVWDRGTWHPDSDPRRQLANGKLEFELEGEKLHGRWVLLRLHDRSGSQKPNWLLIKRQDENARALDDYDVTEARPESVKSGRSLEESQRHLAAAALSRKSVSSSKSRSHRVAASENGNLSVPSSLKNARKEKLPESIEPHLAVLANVTPQGPEWLHEMKLDGYRILACKDKGKVRLTTRRRQDWTRRYPEIAAAVAKLPIETAWLDGELVALLPNGLTSFQALQNVGRDPSGGQLAYFLFDVLYLDGYDLRASPLIERKTLLRQILERATNTRLRYSDHFEDDGPNFFRQCCQMGLEGVVSKRRDQAYRSGRWDDWVKTKCIAREEMVIGGFTLSTATARALKSLLVGYFDNKSFVYAGRVGTGFTMQTLTDLRKRLEPLEQTYCPFSEVPPRDRGRVRWVRPELVAQLEFTGWTDDNILRHPSFEGLREDKPALEVGVPETLSSSSRSSGNKSKPNERGHIRKSSANNRKNKESANALPRSKISLTHPERILFPDCGTTKLDLANYYARVADWMLPHIVDRPLNLVRCPEGHASGKCFFQRHAGVGTPDLLRRVEIKEGNKTGNYVVVENFDGLLALVQMSVLEIHPWGSRRDQLERPDRVIFDFDPDARVSWSQVIDAARAVREILSSYELQSFVKTTGGKGLHVVVPLSPRRHDWAAIKAFARRIAEQLVAQNPSLYTISPLKAARSGKTFVDYLRNDRGATAVAPYSTRAKPGAPVSVPLAWDELSPAVKSDHFQLSNLPARLASMRHDPWAEISKLKQNIPSKLRR